MFQLYNANDGVGAEQLRDSLTKMALLVFVVVLMIGIRYAIVVIVRYDPAQGDRGRIVVDIGQIVRLREVERVAMEAGLGERAHLGQG